MTISLQRPAWGFAWGVILAVLPVALRANPPSRYEFRTEHDPNGIGKFYFGREIAMVMSYHGAPWLERETREQEERLSQLIDVLQLKPGQTVADIGAGSGVISVMLARRVAPGGKVLAVDIQPEMLKLLAQKTEKLDVDNVVPVLGTAQSPKLPAGAVDLAIFVDVYHEFAFPYEMMREIARALKSGGRAVFVEYRKEDPNVPIKLVHKMTQRQVRMEIEQPEFRLRWVETIHTLPRQHVIIFEKQPTPRAEGKSPAPGPNDG